MSDLVAVQVTCGHEGEHEFDTVYLRPKLGLAAGIAVQQLIVRARQTDDAKAGADMTGTLAEAYLFYGIADWTLGIPVSEAAIRSELLGDFERAQPVADAADDLYKRPVIAPLLKKALTSLPSTSSKGSTSARGNGAAPRQKRSKRSSTTTSQTAGTEKISA